MSEHTTSLTDELTGVQTDHGGVSIGDIIVLLLDLVLLIYTGFRSYDFLSNTVPSGWQILALVGLWGLDIGAIAWSLVWIFGSTEKYQDWVSMTFFVIDLVGVVLTSLTDSLMYGAEGKVMTETLTGVAVVVIPLVVVLNVVAGFIYHMTSPATKARRAARRAEAEHRQKMNELARMERDLRYAEEYLLRRQDTLDKSALLASMKVQQDAIERATRAALRDQVGAGDVNGKLAAMKARLDALKAQVGGLTVNGDDAQAARFRQARETFPSDPNEFLKLYPDGQYVPGDASPYRVPAARFARDPNGPKPGGFLAFRHPQQQPPAEPVPTEETTTEDDEPVPSGVDGAAKCHWCGKVLGDGDIQSNICRECDDHESLLRRRWWVEKGSRLQGRLDHAAIDRLDRWVEAEMQKWVAEKREQAAFVSPNGHRPAEGGVDPT